MSTSLPDPKWKRRCSWGEHDVIARRIDRAPPSLGRLLANPHVLPVGAKVPLGSDGSLRLDAPFEPHVRGSLKEWRTSGRLIGHGPRLVRYSRVDLLIAPWSDDACELRVAPRSRHLHQWGARRLRRYYRLAHDAADRLLPMLRSGRNSTVA